MSKAHINLESFSEPVRKLTEKISPCTLCPRDCKVLRSEGEVGFCGIADMPRVSSVGPHFGEEPVLVGPGGSGTIFFAGCNLGCVFCQNSDISHLRYGSETSIEQLTEAMLGLQNHGCTNINFVTPTHMAGPIAAAIESARGKGLTVPTVYNTGGYDSVDTLKLLSGFIDIYMPDMKYADSEVAKQLSDAPDYPQVNQAAVKQMHRQVGNLKVENGLAVSGLLIRHLVLPNRLAGSFEIIDFLADEISASTAINVMAQYRPCYTADKHPQINRYPTAEEIDQVRQYAIQKGLTIIR
ncbi:MAG: radical SAM protein [Planctomycetota bacterium]|mgnify:CR=1 FL=1|nr:MAG: radical SAM protein [Planctomycetota bacterium]